MAPHASQMFGLALAKGLGRFIERFDQILHDRPLACVQLDLGLHPRANFQMFLPITEQGLRDFHRHFVMRIAILGALVFECIG